MMLTLHSMDLNGQSSMDGLHLSHIAARESFGIMAGDRHQVALEPNSIFMARFKMARFYVIYGQGGFITSIGMSNLASRIAHLYPISKVTTHAWKYPSNITNDIQKQSTSTKIILIGYSLGANAVTWVSNSIGRTIDLAVCYDPSVLSLVNNPNTNVKRLLLYHNVDREPEGHAIMTGPQVERTDISMWHLGVCFDEGLHQKTLAAIQQVMSKP